MTEETIKGQMTMFDLGTWYGKTSAEHFHQTEEKISESSLKKPLGSRVKMPLFLDLRTESGGTQDASWQIGGQLLGAYSMHSFVESPNVAVESRLSQILEDNPLPKYSLSAKACQGILNRANAKGKKLPQILEDALLETVRAESLTQCKSDKDASGGAKVL